MPSGGGFRPPLPVMAGAMQVELPPKARALRQPAPYKILWGGRAGAKSWTVARQLLIDGTEKPLRIGCFRELQRSIKESVHQLLADQVSALELGDFYEVQSAQIKAKNGGLIIFDGLRHNAEKIKSYEGLDRAWVEQAEMVSKSSWDILIPTIRKEGSEIWLTINPLLEEDYAYQHFVLRPPPGAIVVEMSWRDNPWISQRSLDQMKESERKDPDAWLNIWEGHCRQALEGAIYAAELREATQDGRITRVPYDRTQPVHTAWDLGHSDQTCIWLFQRVGFETHFIRYYQNNQHHLGHYLQELQSYGYVWGTDFLPHDGDNATLGSLSIAELMRNAGRNVVVVPRTANIGADINAARMRFANCWFDQELCADGLQCLRHYRYDVDEDTGRRSRLPHHDWASDGADAFRTFAVGYQAPTRRRMQQVEPRMIEASGGGQAWLGA